MNAEQYEKMGKAAGFVAALDQSGGSTPGALRAYGIGEDEYSGEEQMFELVHQMRARIMTSPSFDGNRIIAAILFENTMDRTIDDRPTADYLWNVKRVVPILKVDKGLADEADGARVMKPIPNLDGLLARALDKGIFGTKMRSFITLPGKGLDAVVEQQFAIARQILAAGLVPIIEPEIDIHSPRKAEAEDQLKAGLLKEVNKLDADQVVMLKITLPETDDLYTDFVEHARVLRVLALSGGYTRDEACARLARNHGVIASFSRALTQGLSVNQSPEEFDAMLDESIAEIYAASVK
jgi:fructose-bisphosphate aldolase class I